MLAVLKNEGNLFKPKTVILAYLVGTHYREEGFANGTIEKNPKTYFEKIQVVFNENNRLTELRSQSSSVIMALLTTLYLETKWRKKEYASKEFSKKLETLPSGIRYQIECFQDEKLQSIKRARLLPSNIGWQNALAQIESFKKIADERGFQPVFVLLPNAGESFYDSITGRNLPESSPVFQEARLWEQHCQKLGLPMLNLLPIFHEYVSNIPPQKILEEMPFLYDGHPNATGQKIIASNIKSFLKNLRTPK